MYCIDVETDIDSGYSVPAFEISSFPVSIVDINHMP